MNICFCCFYFLKVCLSVGRGPDVAKELMEACLQSDACQQQEKAQSDETFKKGSFMFLLK
jgi:hypothetical protein